LPLIAMRLTFCCAVGNFGRVTLRTPFLNLACRALDPSGYRLSGHARPHPTSAKCRDTEWAEAPSPRHLLAGPRRHPSGSKLRPRRGRASTRRKVQSGSGLFDLSLRSGQNSRSHRAADPGNRCVRFATTVASGHATLATKRTLLLTWTGLPPAGSHQLCLAHRRGD
jgi:hypothetical protein